MMNKLFRSFILFAVIGWGIWGLYPTYQWYFDISEEDKALIGTSAEKLATMDQETKEYIQYLKKIRSKTLLLGLDLQGGVYVATVPDEEDLKKQLIEQYDGDEQEVNKIFQTEKENALIRALEILKNRIDAFGVAEPAIRPTFDGKITIELPGVSDPNLLKEGLAQVGKLEFRFVNQELMNALINQRVPYDSRYGILSLDELPAAFIMPSDSEWLAYWENDSTDVPQLKGWYLIKKQVDLDGSQIKSALVETDNLGRNVVSFELTDEGGEIFADITKNNINRQFAIILDDRVRSAPVIQGEIPGGRGQISGTFTLTEASYLANILEAGALPVRLNIIEERIIGPQLGADSIKRGLQAVLFGTGAVILFMIVWYRVAGIIASFTLLLNVFLLISILASLGATLTLAGIAGIALTVGMAVDANIIIYERIKEEQKRSRNFLSAFHSAYEHASTTIWDSNLTTLIASIALSVFGSGSIKGFGVTLAFGIISNIFTSLFVSKLLLELSVSKSKEIKI
ncbi:MAG: protein translocase subunit SecD [Brevinemataceae bacterium]